MSWQLLLVANQWCKKDNFLMTKETTWRRITTTWRIIPGLVAVVRIAKKPMYKPWSSAILEDKLILRGRKQSSWFLTTYGCFRKYWYPQIIHFNRVFHYFHQPFWGFSPYFLETPKHFLWWSSKPGRRCLSNWSEGPSEMETLLLLKVLPRSAWQMLSRIVRWFLFTRVQKNGKWRQQNRP